ncbi:MAG: UDP-N-acetylglucosamine 2-epimerase (non-hydrolyzing), partial [Salibacteraceae bacterium]|nr:UDP-N-acetylglucosamine 2-epimerase (non-hydrolyzing) [Salibacteraceae bacterium]
MKILTIVGARPQFIKAAALSRELKSRAGVEEILVHTGQHFDKNMSDVFFDEMNIPKPKYNLEINSLGHGAMTGRMLEGIEKLLLDEKPNMLLVYGDTNSTIAGALAAKKIHVPVGHVEAGLRSFNMRMPEEVNRILTDRISDHLFCPTDTAINNLKNEGFNDFDCKIHRSGDVMQDAALYYAQFSEEKSDVLAKLGNPKNFVLTTIHRAENTDDPIRLTSIISALNEINKSQQVICPLHPRTRKILENLPEKPAFSIIDPVGYFDMIELLKHASLVMTDSGGLQKEAFFFQNACITMRDQTEWT